MLENLISKVSPYRRVKQERCIASMSVCGVFICISVVCSYHGEYREDFMDSRGYGGYLGDFAIYVLDSEMGVNDEENAGDSKTMERCLLIHAQPTWLTAVRERLVEFYSDETTPFTKNL